MFYADIEGHPSDHMVQLAMQELGFFSTEVRILGTYPADAFRNSMGQDALSAAPITPPGA